MVYDNKPRRNLFVDRKFRIQVCSQTILDIYENVMLYNNKTFSIFSGHFSVDKMLLICQQKKFRLPKNCPTIFPKKKLCSQNEKFLKSFVTLIFFSVTNVKKLPRLFSKKKKWTNICPFFQKTENTFEKRQLFDISHILGWPTFVTMFLLSYYILLLFIMTK